MRLFFGSLFNRVDPIAGKSARYMIINEPHNPTVELAPPFATNPMALPYHQPVEAVEPMQIGFIRRHNKTATAKAT